MTDSDWKIIKDKIYYSDGSWRDIYIKDTTVDDWLKWINFVNESYSVGFYNVQTELTESKISPEATIDYLTGKTDSCVHATIRIEQIILKCHFFSNSEIENDIDPKEVRSVNDHNRLIDYMASVSKILNKRVIMTPENMPDFILILAENSNIEINLSY